MDKRALRAEARRVRAAVGDRARRSAQICAQVQALPEFARAHCVFAYAATGSEVDLFPAIEAALRLREKLGGTVTDGIISALDREVTVEGKNMTLLQTSAAVSPGNSGGGLFNEKGELVGIVNAKSGGDNVEGIGFAVPINTAMEVAEQLIANGYVSGRPAMGIQVIAITDLQTAMQAGVSQLGVYVQSVDPGSAAEQAGLQVGDLFVSVDGTAVSTTSDVTAVLDEHQVGDVIEVQVVRDKQVLSLNVTLQEKTAGTTAQPVEG